MKRIIEELKKTTMDMWNKGWTEANGGNISMRLEHSALETTRPTGDWSKLPEPCSALASDFLFLTGAGKHLRNFEVRPEETGGVIEVSQDGCAWRPVWGFAGGARPTSELAAHLHTHDALKTGDANEPRCLVHCHPPNLIALSYALDLDTLSLSKLLWVMQTECLIVFPRGVSFLPWHVPGTLEIGKHSAALLKERPTLLWQFHGALAVGRDLDEALGRIHVAEKTAGIFLKARACGSELRFLSDAQLQALCDQYACDVDPAIMAARPPF